MPKLYFKSKYKSSIKLIIFFGFTFLVYIYIFHNVSTKSSLKPVNKIKYDFDKEFKYIINHHCKSEALVLNMTCLNKLKQLDLKIRNINKQRDKCYECLDENNSRKLVYHHS